MSFKIIDRKATGKIGEEHASLYLRNSGYKIIEKNWRCRYGEIDIIADIDGTICFVEVKSRQSTAYGYPEESIDWNKLKKINTAASYYISLNDLNDKSIRFDAISVLIYGDKISIRHIKDISYFP